MANEQYSNFKSIKRVDRANILNQLILRASKCGLWRSLHVSINPTLLWTDCQQIQKKRLPGNITIVGINLRATLIGRHIYGRPRDTRIREFLIDGGSFHDTIA